MVISGGTPGSQKNTARDGGVIYSGTFNGPIATTTGDAGSATNVSSGMQDQLINALRDQLGEARRLLKENHDPEKTADCADAVEEIDMLDRELAERREYRDPGKLRHRLKQLVGTLTPVTDIIGGTAAFLEIINALKSMF